MMRFEGTATYVAGDELKTAVNAAIALERPLLVKGEPGTGKTLLAQEIADALGAPFIAWHVKSTTRAQQGLYEYDAVSRLRDSQLGDPRVSEIANYIRQGKLWEAFVSPERPVLLIDEIDKADIEFPSDLLLEPRSDGVSRLRRRNRRDCSRRTMCGPSSSSPPTTKRSCRTPSCAAASSTTSAFPTRRRCARSSRRTTPGSSRGWSRRRCGRSSRCAETPGLKKRSRPLRKLLDWLKLLLNEDISPPEALREARHEETDPSPAWRASQERAGRAPVREARFPGPKGSGSSLAPFFFLVQSQFRRAALVTPSHARAIRSHLRRGRRRTNARLLAERRRICDHARRALRTGLRTGGYVIDFWGLGYDIAERMGACRRARGDRLPHPRVSRRGRPRRKGRGVRRDGSLFACGGPVHHRSSQRAFPSVVREGGAAHRGHVLGDQIAAIHEEADAAHVEFERAPARRLRSCHRRGTACTPRCVTFVFGPEARFEKRSGLRDRGLRGRKALIARATMTSTSSTTSRAYHGRTRRMHERRTARSFCSSSPRKPG